MTKGRDGRSSAALVLALVSVACWACNDPRNALEPTPLPAAAARLPTSGAGSLSIEWSCIQTRRISGVPLGIPVNPACGVGTRAVASRSLAAASVATATISPPSNLIASVSGSTVTLNWLPPPVSVTSFVIEAGSFPRYADLATFDTSSPVTSAVFFNVSAGYYYVRVRARNGADVSATSNEVLVTVEGGNCTGTLYAPDFRVTGAGSSVTLTWDAPTIGCPPTEYVIEAGSARGGIDLANFRTGSAVPRYDATGVGAGTYYVRMRAANDVGVSYASSEKILVFSSGCLYAVGPSTVFISRGGIGGGVSLETSPTCSWTISADAPWLTLAGGGLPVAGQGSRLVAMNVNVNLGPVQTATLMVRWPGGGADVPVTQNGFGFYP